VAVSVADNFSFYGFPSHYYEEKYPNIGSREVATKVLDAFKEAGIKAEGVKRGLDHGVWASFKCGMSPFQDTAGQEAELTSITQHSSQIPTR
jgi:aromatic ring-opening dioxygenase catalytic subunit (LigB family)